MNKKKPVVFQPSSSCYLCVLRVTQADKYSHIHIAILLNPAQAHILLQYTFIVCMNICMCMCYTFGYIRTHTYVRCKSVKVAARYAPLVAIAFSAVNATATVQVTHCSVPWRVKRASSTNKQNIHTNKQTNRHFYTYIYTSRYAVRNQRHI